MGNGSVILITGTPGTGKTTVARELSRILGCSYANVAELAKARGLLLSWDEETMSYEVDVEGLRKVIGEMARECLIVDSHIAEVVPKDALRVAVVLRLDPRILEERLRRRGYPDKKVLENVQCEILDCCLVDAINAYGAEYILEIDTTGKSVEHVVREILDALSAGRKGVCGIVDWISKLGEEVYRYLR